MLDYVGLPFDPTCLDFHANKRAVHTPSASRCASPSTATASTIGVTTPPGSPPCRAPSVKRSTAGRTDSRR
jgi:hypothetical protein